MEEENKLVPKSSSDLVSEQSNELMDKIVEVEADDVDEMKQLIAMFNLVQQKKNALRILKYNGLLDSLADQMEVRIGKKADEFSNDDLLKYMQTISGAIDKANTQLKLVDETPPIQINKGNTVNINVSAQELSREERERVAEVIKQLMQNANTNQRDDDIIVEDDSAVVEENSTDRDSSENKSQE